MATSFLSRWSKRKLDQNDQLESEQPVEEEVVIAPNDNNDSPQETADSQSSVGLAQTEADQSDEEQQATLGSALSSDAEKHLKKMAMRKLFMSEFNQVDALNDYDHDYSQVKSLSSEIAGQLRDWVKNVDDTEAKEAQENPVEISDADSSPNEESTTTSSELEHKNQPTIEDLRPEQQSQAHTVGQNIPHEK
ncbi:DUF3306 domain-containing protein [Vibrio intestinalis]|uniref:DUF3306 domain-containing protein n=1 Tax=Vibrio intestinalis TaxID=2933291 RepID=UPI0021A458B2